MRRVTATALVVLALALALAGCTDDDDEPATPTTALCDTVAFTPNSEDAASDIQATGISCADAEAFVRVAGLRTSSGGPDRVDVGGFHCVRVGSQQEPLPRSTYECTDGARQVTFVRS